MMYAPFEDPKSTKEIDRLLSEGEAERRKHWDAKGKMLDWWLMALAIGLVVIAVTRVAVWLAKVL